MIGVLMPFAGGGDSPNYIVTVGRNTSNSRYGYEIIFYGSISPNNLWAPQPTFGILNFSSDQDNGTTLLFQGSSRPTVAWAGIRIGANTYPRAQWVNEGSSAYRCAAAINAFGTTVGAQVPVWIL